MSKDRLSKEEAYKLIAAIVDDEVEENKRSAFFECIKENPSLRNEFESVQRIKTLIADRCPSHNAPDRLKVRVQDFLLNERNSLENMSDLPSHKDIKDVDIPSHISTSSKESKSLQTEKNDDSPFLKWMYAAAASFLIIAAFWGLVYNNQQEANQYNIEEYVYQHFEEHNGKLVPPNIATASLADAELSLSSNYDMPMTVPPLNNAEFKGVAFREFVPGFEAPLLEYYLPGEDQYIYIFAFKMDQLNEFTKLVRNEEAIKKCIQPEDFHIEEINGKHVVSWRWDGTWYAAISNHNGRTLASLVEPLKYELNSSK